MKLKDIVDYIKLEHTVFDLPFVFSGAVLASAGQYNYVKLLLILVATTFARATAMSVNRIEGLKFDRLNPRKKEWLLVTGKMRVRTAFALTIIFGAIFEISAFLLNRFVFILSPIVLFLFVTDPFLKRITPWRHIYMGLTIGVGVLAGYLAITPAFPVTWPLYLIFFASSLWIAGFDMIYTIPDMEHDRTLGLRTVMTDYGIKRGLLLSNLIHALTFTFFLILGFYLRSVFYFLSLIPISILIFYQHYIVNPDDPRSIKVSFQNSNTFIGFIFLIGVLLSVGSQAL
ncbi:MAG: putative 4-hydroxybenzoate polyprenyltransferase [Candidatus Thermoplasmatota archaeon]|jgi:4-hydroxybenzoate polyprenyltransferase|nr:putative 4-hydroxybenzoate polyprenyltransferase [Candidatus Thermoplasmatota archaeon]MCL5955728.1 putative 4-hydroxybenzoate polyprenyltransferase [Candidatus Thermoplasmatota archaeon]